MKKIIFIILTVLSVKLAAQNHLAGFNLSASRTNNSISDYSDKFLHRTGFSEGLSYDLLLKEHFPFGAELLYDLHDLTPEIEAPTTGYKIYNENAMEKSKAQKRIAWVLLGSGAGIAAIGGLVQLSHEQQTSGTLNFDFTGAMVAIAGGVVGLTSIPFFINSAKNARKATSVTFSNQQLFLSQQSTISQKSLPTLTVKIKF